MAANLVPRQTVRASCYDEKIGNTDNNLYGDLYYSELSKDFNKKDFKALGGLPNNHRIQITYGGKTIIAKKGDVGAGGPNNPKIDIHIKAAREFIPNLQNCQEWGIRDVEIVDA